MNKVIEETCTLYPALVIPHPSRVQSGFACWPIILINVGKPVKRERNAGVAWGREPLTPFCYPHVCVCGSRMLTLVKVFFIQVEVFTLLCLPQFGEFLSTSNTFFSLSVSSLGPAW